MAKFTYTFNSIFLHSSVLFYLLFLFLPPPRQVSNFRNSIDLITYQIAAKVDAMVGIFGIFNGVECDEINMDIERELVLS